MKSIAEILPVYGVEKDMILSKMGDMTVGYALELPEILTMSGEEYETFHHFELIVTIKPFLAEVLELVFRLVRCEL